MPDTHRDSKPTVSKRKAASRRQYSNGVVTLEMSEQEFKDGGYAMQAFVDVGPAKDPAPTVVVDGEDGEK